MTLPTRDDGGIDWDKYNDGLILSGYTYQTSQGMITRSKQIAAHTRERCAKIAEAPDGPDPDGNIAAAIRKMED